MLALARLIQHPVCRGGLALVCAVAVGSSWGCGDDEEDGSGDENGDTNGDDGAEENRLSFFVSSTTQDGNLGGVEGADQICQTLATEVGAGDRTWVAYLSAENGGTPIHARDRIGTGPWWNALDVMLAADLAELHTLIGDADLFVTETGEKVNGQWNGSNGQDGSPPNEHDIMTGSDANGMLLIVADETTTCDDWTSNTLTPGPQVGHTDGMGPMMDTSEPRYTSWNGGHATLGCSAADLAMTGSTGRIYCFAAD
jgi:hypothetical protein